MNRFGCLALALLVVTVVALPIGLQAAEDENGVTVYTQPVYSKEQMERAAGEIPPVALEAPTDRWSHLPRTAGLLRQNGALRIVMIGDSIVNDTTQSRWEDRLQTMYPQSRIVKTTCVRGSTGCWWFKEEGRVKRYVLDHNPDLVMIGGISHKDDVDSVRDVVRQIRAALPCDILLLTGAFGYVDPRDDKQWSFEADPADYRSRLRRLAEEEKAALLDMTAYWGKYIRESGKELDWFKRDAVHANERGMQVLGQILVKYFSPPVGG
jgi:hypothetical protein